MGPRAMRTTSRKAASELPETARANFLTAAAQLLSTSLPQLSTHLGQQALLYANAQQTPVTSLTARSQLCRKCGSPLNQRTCANVHIAWLSRTSSERLSKKLPASFSGPSSHLRGESAAGQKQKNKVVAVRVCVACQEPSVRPFLSVGLAQKHLAAEGFTEVPMVGQNHKQQAEARKQQQQQQQQGALQPQQQQALPLPEQQQPGKSKPQQHHDQPARQEPSEHAGHLLVSPAVRTQEQQHQQEQHQKPTQQLQPSVAQQKRTESNVPTAVQTGQQQQQQKRGLEGPITCAAKRRSASPSAAVGQQQESGDLAAQQQQPQDSCAAPQQQQQQQGSCAPALHSLGSMDQQAVLAAVSGTDAAAAALDDVTRGSQRPQKAAAMALQADTVLALRDQQQQQQQADASFMPRRASTAVGYICDEGNVQPPAAAVLHTSSMQQLQQQQVMPVQGAAAATPEVVAATADTTAPTDALGAAVLATVQEPQPPSSAAAAEAVIAVGGPVSAAAVVTPEQPGATAAAAPAVVTHPVDATAPAGDAADDQTIHLADLGAAASAAEGDIAATRVAVAVPMPLSEGIERMPSLCSWQATPPPATAAPATQAEGQPAETATNLTPVSLQFGAGVAEVSPQPALAPAVAGGLAPAHDVDFGLPVPANSATVTATATAAAAHTSRVTAAAVATTVWTVSSMELDWPESQAAEFGAAAVAAPEVAELTPPTDAEMATQASEVTSSQQQQQQQQSVPAEGFLKAAALAPAAMAIGVAVAQQLVSPTVVVAAPTAAALEPSVVAAQHIESARTATTTTTLATPAGAAAAAGGLRGVFVSRGGKSAAARPIAQVWPLAPVAAPAAAAPAGPTTRSAAAAAAGVLSGQALECATPGLVVVPDDRREATDAAAAAVYGLGPAQMAPAETESVVNAPVTAVQVGPVVFEDIDMTDAAAVYDAHAEPIETTEVVQHRSAAVQTVLLPAPAVDEDVLQRAPSLPGGTSSGIEADVRSEIESEAAGGSSDEQLAAASAVTATAKQRFPCSAAAAAVAALEPPAAGDCGADQAASDSCAVPYQGPWAGGIRPAHASDYDDTDEQSHSHTTPDGGGSASEREVLSAEESNWAAEHTPVDSEPASESASESELEGLSESTSGSEAGCEFESESPGEAEPKTESEEEDGLPGILFAAATALEQPAGVASAAVGSKDAGAGSLGTQPSVGGPQRQRRQQEQVQDSDQFVSDEAAGDESELQSKYDESELSAEDEDMSAEYSSHGTESDKTDDSEQKQGLQQQQQQHDMRQSVPSDRKCGGGRQRPKKSMNDLMARFVCIRRHLLMKRVGRKALRHIIYR